MIEAILKKVVLDTAVLSTSEKFPRRTVREGEILNDAEATPGGTFH